MTRCLASTPELSVFASKAKQARLGVVSSIALDCFTSVFVKARNDLFPREQVSPFW
ncbi:hypothetical protein [Legionella beliardensis]|uniref:hypothetical protein n=1 Tax=Legionella beliardensis TaxID=91822 RepID=UPI001A944D47|nr:hypothetical protein [Legionella beliardensis]